MSPVRPTVQVIGHRLDIEHHRLRDFLTRTAQPHEFFELVSPEASELLTSRGLAAPDLPAEVALAAPGMDWRRLEVEGVDVGLPRRAH
ncbi:MAG: hypothetical protein ACR2ML_11890 [Solirubrobacteraceae bacterium]